MDEFDDGLEVTGEERNSSRLPVIALWIGLVGIIVGATGIFLANQAQRNLTELETEIKAQPDKTPEIEASVGSLEERLERLGSEFVKLTRKDTEIRESVQDGFDQIQRNIRENRSGVNALSGKIEEVIEELEKLEKRASRTVPAAPETGVDDTEPREANEDETVLTTEGAGVHYIERGDTLSKIATKHGLTLSQLQQANPTVDPRRLQIGQEIIIPAP
ncbi:MAG: LysM peptidoglycan-binding domain-containing protein [Oceanipulchritudo sp.]